MVIAIDGPSGAGKSEISRRLAARLGIAYLDTGALYRAVGMKAFEEGVSPEGWGSGVAVPPSRMVPVRASYTMPGPV